MATQQTISLGRSLKGKDAVHCYVLRIRRKINFIILKICDIYKIDAQKIQDGNFSLAIKCEGLFKSVKLFEDHIESIHQRTFEMDMHSHLLIAHYTSNGASGKVINDLRVFPNFPKKT